MAKVYDLYDARFEKIYQFEDIIFDGADGAVNFTKPTRVGGYEILEERVPRFGESCEKTPYPQFEFREDSGRLKDLSPFPVAVLKKPYDLNEGFEHKVAKHKPGWPSDHKEGLGTLLQFLSHPSSPELPRKPTFIAWRGILQRIMSAFYSLARDTPDLFGAVKSADGTIHLFMANSHQSVEDAQNVKPFLQRLFYQGRSFENFVNGQPPTAANPVNENLENVDVFRAKLGDFDLLYGAEMDGQNLEMKTTGELAHQGQVQTLLRKSQKWWSQCFLVNVERLIVGYRTRHGMVHKISEIPVKQLAKRSADLWSWQRSLQFLCKVLGLIKERVVEQDRVYLVKMDYPDRTVNFLDTQDILTDLNF